MNKSELAAAVAERTESTPAQARRQVDAVLDSIVESVSAGERVSLLGFGTFIGTERPARTARNPRTGDAVEVPAAVVPRFRAGSGFRARVSGGEAASAGAGAPAAADEAVATPKTTKTKDGTKAKKNKKKDKKKDKGKAKGKKKKNKK